METHYTKFSLICFNAVSWRPVCTDMKSLVCIPECECTVIYLNILFDLHLGCFQFSALKIVWNL